MGNAIGQTLSLAVVAALSPVPIIAVILMLVTPRARSNGPAFVVGWLVGFAIVGTIVLVVAGPTQANDDGEPATWVDVLKLALGVLLVLLAVKQWRHRPRPGEEAAMPSWMGAVDAFTPVKAAVTGLVCSAGNPKNLILAVAAAASIAQTGIPGGEQAIAYAVFALIASLGVGTPIGIYFGMGDRAGPILDDLKAWMGRYNAVIMAVLCLVIGVKLVGDGISGLS